MLCRVSRRAAELGYLSDGIEQQQPATEEGDACERNEKPLDVLLGKEQKFSVSSQFQPGN
jgi:hypothetical protein